MSFLHRLPLLLAALFTLGPVVAQDQKATPKQAAQDKAAARDDEEPYNGAVRYVDEQQRRLFDALERTGLKVDDVQHYICHQSNQRIIESAIEKLKLPPERVYINIDRYGNTSAASIPICLDELNEAGRIEAGKPIVLVAFGAGVTWASCVWNT